MNEPGVTISSHNTITTITDLLQKKINQILQNSLLLTEKRRAFKSTAKVIPIIFLEPEESTTDYDSRKGA